MSSYQVTVTFELADGRELECRYSVHVTPGNYTSLPENCYPDEADVSEPEYLLDREEIDVKNLPKGLEVIAEAMYDNGESDGRFRYSESKSEPDYEPDDFGWDD